GDPEHHHHASHRAPGQHAPRHGDSESPRRRLRWPDARDSDHRPGYPAARYLRRRIARGIGRRRGERRAGQSHLTTTTDVTTQRSILIVDDEFGLAEMLREMLRELDYDVTLAINGRL